MSQNNERYIQSKTTYFTRMGVSNTDDTLRLARERFEELGLKKVVIATSFGKTPLEALKYFKGEEIVVINSMYGFRVRGQQSLEPEIKKQMEDAGMTLVYTTHAFAGIERSFNQKFGGIGFTQFAGQLFKMLGEGFKVCVEMAVMAADCGAIDVDEEAMFIAGTVRGCDTAAVLVPAYSNAFFDLQIKELVCMPRVRSLKGQPLYHKVEKGNSDKE